MKELIQKPQEFLAELAKLADNEMLNPLLEAEHEKAMELHRKLGKFARNYLFEEKYTTEYAFATTPHIDRYRGDWRTLETLNGTVGLLVSSDANKPLSTALEPWLDAIVFSIGDTPEETELLFAVDANGMFLGEGLDLELADGLTDIFFEIEQS